MTGSLSDYICPYCQRMQRRATHATHLQCADWST